MRIAFCLIGILALVGSFIGVKLVLDQEANAQGVRQKENDAGKPQDKIICWGHFDVEQGIAGLYPKQFGDVVFVAAENTKVEKDAVLLKTDDAMALKKVQLAELDVKNAQNLLAKARLLTPNFQLQAEQQTAAIRAVEFEIEKVQLDRKKNEALMTSPETNPELKKRAGEYYDVATKALGEKKKAEEAKLKQIKLQDAKYDIAQAETDLKAKEIQLQMAQELVKYHRILAPSDGTVLRVFTRKGETLGAHPRIHALEFLPKAPIIVRAEVLQEWGHYVKVGQKVDIEDDTYMGKTWQGTVKSVSGSYAQKRSPIIEPFTFNDVRTLECLITVDSGEERKFIGQRVRAKILTNP